MSEPIRALRPKHTGGAKKLSRAGARARAPGRRATVRMALLLACGCRRLDVPVALVNRIRQRRGRALRAALGELMMLAISASEKKA